MLWRVVFGTSPYPDRSGKHEIRKQDLAATWGLCDFELGCRMGEDLWESNGKNFPRHLQPLVNVSQ